MIPVTTFMPSAEKAISLGSVPVHVPPRVTVGSGVAFGEVVVVLAGVVVVVVLVATEVP